jgi:hypothetical protein
VCLRADGFEIHRDETVRTRAPASDGSRRELEVGRLVASRDGRGLLSLFAFGTRDLVTASYLQFFLHHAPRALVRSPRNGFVLRVESSIEARSGGEAAAEARCAAFLRAVLPEVEAALR